MNALAGPNGAGKTNLLEAAHALALTRGFHPDKELVQHGAAYYSVSATLWPKEATEVLPNDLTLSYVPGRPKKMLYDGQALAKLSEHVGRLPVVSVLPEDTQLIGGPAADRRAWLDALLAQADVDYLAALTTYQHALKQRNALLRAAGENHHLDEVQLEIWDHQLVVPAVVLQQKRKALLGALQPDFAAAHAAIVQADAPLLTYQPNVPPDSDLLTELTRARRRDLALGRTTAGPHRDDLGFELDGHPLRPFGSQGQRKTFVTALKMAQAAYLTRLRGRPPLLLLDDLFDKLDHARVGRLTAYLHQHFTGQVLVTDTDTQRLQTAFADLPDACFYRVAEGEVHPV